MPNVYSRNALTHASDLTYDEAMHVTVGGHRLPANARIIGLWFVDGLTEVHDADWWCCAWRDKDELTMRYRVRDHLSPWTDRRSTKRDEKTWCDSRSPWVSDPDSVAQCRKLANKVAEVGQHIVFSLLVLGNAAKFISMLQADSAPTWLNFG